MHFHRHHCHRGPIEGGGGGHDYRRHWRFGRGDGGRFFEQGDLRFVILKLLSEKPSHGYEIIKAIEDRLGGAYTPSPGVIYPTLTLLEETGLIAAAQSEGPRKLYEITAEGRAALERDKATVDAIFARMGELNERLGGGPAPQLIRAFQNLKTALRLRVRRGPLTPAQIATIANLLDEAAKTVETM
jgi:DNA-binding PadR family transcriptional regulator